MSCEYLKNNFSWVSPVLPIGFSSGNHWKYYTVVLVPLGGAAFIVFLS